MPRIFVIYDHKRQLNILLAKSCFLFIFDFEIHKIIVHHLASKIVVLSMVSSVSKPCTYLFGGSEGYFKASLPFSQFSLGDMETDIKAARDILLSSFLCVGMAAPFLTACPVILGAAGMPNLLCECW